MNGTICPICGGDSHVLYSRENADGNYVRRRECEACFYRWNSVEIQLDALPVAKRPS